MALDERQAVEVSRLTLANQITMANKLLKLANQLEHLCSTVARLNEHQK